VVFPLLVSPHAAAIISFPSFYYSLHDFMNHSLW